MSFLTPRRSGLDVMLLLWRLAASGLLCFGHGIGKLHVLQTDPSGFPDPLGVGPTLSILSAMAAECLGSLFVAVGVLTRAACLVILFTMAMVALVVHHNDTWVQTEPSVLFFLIFSMILALGPGRYSFDAWRRA